MVLIRRVHAMTGLLLRNVAEESKFPSLDKEGRLRDEEDFATRH